MLYHFSEEPDISLFAPRKHPSHPEMPPVVWAIDQARSPLYLFPRDCPRIAFYPTEKTSAADLEHYHSDTNAFMVIAVEQRWLQQIANSVLYCYHLPAESFACVDEGAGYYTSGETITPLFVEKIDHLLQRLCASNVELRITPSLFPLRDRLLASTLHYSMIRMRNARR